MPETVSGAFWLGPSDLTIGSLVLEKLSLIIAWSVLCIAFVVVAVAVAVGSAVDSPCARCRLGGHTEFPCR